MFGREAKLPIDLVFQDRRLTANDLEDSIDDGTGSKASATPATTTTPAPPPKPKHDRCGFLHDPSDQCLALLHRHLRFYMLCKSVQL